MKNMLKEEKTMKNDTKATIISMEPENEGYIRFKDGVIVTDDCYNSFPKKQSANSDCFVAFISDHTGECRTMNCGKKATITSYRDSKDVEVTFEDGVVISHKSYDSFKKGSVAHPKHNSLTKKFREGEVRFMNNGQKATIIVYKKSSDIDIQFEDGTVVKHKTYQSFKKGKIKNLNYNSHLHEERTMNNGQKATIIVYRKYNDIDIRFENGTIVTSKRYDHFLEGNIRCPDNK